MVVVESVFLDLRCMSQNPILLKTLLPTVIKKDVQLHTHQVLSPAASMSKGTRRERREESGADVLNHRYSCKESQDQAHWRPNLTHRTTFLEILK